MFRYSIISISKNILDKLFQEILDSPNYELTIDVQNQTITTPSKQAYDFDISDSDKERIIEGYDDIGLSLMHKNKIEQYEKKMKQKKPWMFGKQS